MVNFITFNPFSVLSKHTLQSILPKQQQALNNILNRLSVHLVIADLLECQCHSVRNPRSAHSRHTLFSASLRRARMPLHDLVAQVKHGTAEARCPDMYLQKVKQAIFTFKRRIVALQRSVPPGASSDLNDLIHSAHTAVRRIRNHSDTLDAWIADRAKWWASNKSGL